MTGITDGLNALFYLAILGVALFIGALGYGGYVVYDYYCNDTIIESTVEVNPTYILTTDGKTIDTLYIYTFKK